MYERTYIHTLVDPMSQAHDGNTMTDSRDYVQVSEDKARAHAAVAGAICCDTKLTDPSDRVAKFARAGFGRYDWMVKAAVSPIDSGDVHADVLPFSAAFLRGVDAISILGSLDAALRLDLRTAARIQIVNVTAHETAEGAQKAIGTMSFDASTDRPDKIVAEIVASNEAVNSLNPPALAGVTSALTSACAVKTDEYVIAALLASTGGSPGSATDIGTLLGAISDGRPARPALIADWVGLLATFGSIQDVLALRQLGVTIHITPQAAGNVIAVDQAGLLVSDSGGQVMTARHATIEMSDDPENESGTRLNLWQSNMTALRAERWLRFVVRPGAAAFISAGS